MTELDKAKLAKFAGLMLQREPKLWCGVANDLSIIIPGHKWSPDTNPAHGDLVLRAWAEQATWYNVFRVLVVDAHTKADEFDFLPAVCQAAIEIIDRQKGD